MTQDPKKLPNWLRGKKKKDEAPPQQETPPTPASTPAEPPSQASAPSDDASLPPWLRNDPPPPTPPAPSKVRRLAPPAPEQPGGIPPWLAGMDESKSYKIGGTELSEEYLKGGDALPDTLDSEMTYDSWMADQLESKREKDIEEEIPDLLSSITPDDSVTRPEGKKTGQLPDWFLGLEELDTTDAPDWFGGDDAGAKPAASADTMPPWINDMVDEQPEPEPVDEIGSFFDSLGSDAPVQQEEEEIDWFNHPENDELDDIGASDDHDIPGVPTDDFFTQLVSGGRSTPASEPPARSSAKPPAEVRPTPRPQLELPDIDDFIEEEEEQTPPAVVIPQNELDAFFDNVAAVRSAPVVDDFEDPDLEWIVPSEPVAEELPPEPEPEPEPPSAAQAEDTMSWLNQLQNIVSSASRPAEPPPEEVVSFGMKENWDTPQKEAKDEVDDFAWPDAPDEEPAPPEETQETEWFNSITPDDAVEDVVEPSPTAAPPPASRSSLLSGRLAQAKEPPAPLPAAPDMDDLPDNLFGDAFPTDQGSEEALIPEHELQSGWLTDDLFSDSEPAAPVQTTDSGADDDDFFSRLQSQSDANVLDDNAAPAQEAQGQWDAPDNPLADTDFLNSLGLDQPAAAQEDQVGQWDSTPQSEAEPLGDDFFTSLGINEQPAASEEDALGQWSAEQSSAAPLEDDFFTSLGIDQPTSAAPQNESYGQWDNSAQDEAEPAQEDDFYAMLGMSDEDQAEPAAPQAEQADQWGSTPQSEAEPLEDDFFASLTSNPPAASEEDTTGQWGAQPGEAEPVEDDFFASLGMSDEAQAEPAAPQAELYDPWENQPQSEAEPVEDDFFTSLTSNPPAASEEDASGQWGVQQSEAERREESFYSLLSMSDEEQAQSAASDEDPFGEWDAQPADTEIPEEDDFFASLSSNEEQPVAAQGEQFGQWDAQTGDAEMPDDDELYGLFGTNDADQAQPAASQAEAYSPWGTQPADDEMPQEDDFFTSLSSNEPAAASEEDTMGQWGTQPTDDETPQEFDPYATRDVRDLLGTQAASEEDQFGQWGTPPSEEALQEDDFFARLGLNDEDDTSPTPPAEAEQLGQWQADNAPQSDDFFAQLGTNNEDTPSDAEDDPFGWNPLQPEEPAQDDNFLGSLGFKDDENDALPSSNDDVFAQWDDQAQAEAASQADDFFASLDPNQPPAKPEQDTYSWDNEAAADMPPTEDFFSAIGLLSEADLPVETAPTYDKQEAPSEEDFFTSLGMLSDDQQPTQPMPNLKNEPQTYGDVDSYLASLNVGEPDVTPTSDDFYSGSDSMDIDALFSQPVMKDRPKVEAAEGETLAGANEDWLNQLQASVGEVSASAIVRQKEDRPVEELSDRLKKLRAKAEQIPDEAPAAQSDALTDMLPSGPSALSSAPFIDVAPGLVGSIALTSEQQSRVELLKGLVPADTRGESHISAIDATYDSPFMADLEDSEESVVVPIKKEEAPVRPRTRRRTRQRIRLDRVLIAALIALAVIVPFTIRGFRVGDLPPSSFAPGSSAQTAFSQINDLKAGDLVLVGMEYAPTSAAELDSMATALLRNILMKAAYPVIISGDPLTILRSQDLMTSINADSSFLQRIGASQPLVSNSDYYIIRYLPGSVIGLRAFSQNTANLLLTDVQGQATNLVIHSMQDFALVTVVTDSAETMRGYAEQIAPLTRAPLVSAVSYGAAPLAEPYAHALGGGLLVGYRDAYTYTDLLDSVSARSISQHSLRIIPTEPPTEAPAIAPPVENGSPEPSAQSTAEATQPSAAQSMGTATVISRQSVNMRSGAGTTNPVIATVPSGSVLSVLGLSGDGQWVHVVLDNGQDGWISAALLSLDVKQASKLQPQSHPKFQQLDPGDPSKTPAPNTRQQATPVSPTPVEAVTVQTTAETVGGAVAETQAVIPPSATPLPTATATATPEPTATVEVVAAVPLPPPSPGYRDERWYAINLGIIASTLVITFGAVVNILRGLLRRGRSS